MRRNPGSTRPRRTDRPANAQSVAGRWARHRVRAARRAKRARHRLDIAEPHTSRCHLSHGPPPSISSQFTRPGRKRSITRFGFGGGFDHPSTANLRGSCQFPKSAARKFEVVCTLCSGMPRERSGAGRWDASRDVPGGPGGRHGHRRGLESVAVASCGLWWYHGKDEARRAGPPVTER